MNINLSAGINKTGYGCVATNILKTLYQKGHHVCLFPIGNPDIESPAVNNAWNASIKNADTYNGQNPSLKIWHEFDLAARFSNTLNTALTFFEGNKLNQRAVNHINSLDYLYVASKWAKNIVEEHCNTTCEVLPMGADDEIFKPSEPNDSETYKFFSTGKLEKRKGHDILVELFNNAFTEKDDVQLYIKWDNPFIHKEEQETWERLYKNSPLGHKIHFIRTQYHHEVAELIKSCHCGIYPTRSEGFGLGILETIASNRPVITTDYSAQAEICQTNNSLKVPIQKLTPAIDGKWFYGQFEWANIGTEQKDQFIEHMRYCFRNNIRDNPGYENVISYYNWDNCVDILTESLKVKEREVNLDLE